MIDRVLFANIKFKIKIASILTGHLILESGNKAVPGDYDGDGRNDAGVFRSSNNTWYINRTTAGTLIQQFGTTGDVPLPNGYVR